MRREGFESRDAVVRMRIEDVIVNLLHSHLKYL
jgi:hypothetical protein